MSADGRWDGDEKQATGPFAARSASKLAGLAPVIRARREELGLRQDELALLAGCSTRLVHSIEHAKASVQFDKLLAVLEVLGFELVLRPGRAGLVVPPVRSPATRR